MAGNSVRSGAATGRGYATFKERQNQGLTNSGSTGAGIQPSTGSSTVTGNPSAPPSNAQVQAELGAVRSQNAQGLRDLSTGVGGETLGKGLTGPDGKPLKKKKVKTKGLREPQPMTATLQDGPNVISADKLPPELRMKMGLQ